MNTIPTWIKSMEHGVLAEARTKEYLLNKFWVLERSVDINGADFIIQRRFTDRDFMNKTMPRLGFVQSKFASNTKTKPLIKREYVCDENKIPFPLFFLVLHTGEFDTARIFLLTSSEIMSTANLVEREGNQFFEIKSGLLLVQNQFEVTKTVKDSLEKIDRAIELLEESDYWNQLEIFLTGKSDITTKYKDGESTSPDTTDILFERWLKDFDKIHVLFKNIFLNEGIEIFNQNIDKIKPLVEPKNLSNVFDFRSFAFHELEHIVEDEAHRHRMKIDKELVREYFEERNRILQKAQNDLNDNEKKFLENDIELQKKLSKMKLHE